MLTNDKLLAECARVEASRRDAGLDPAGAMILVTIWRARPPTNWARVLVRRGIYGRYIGEAGPHKWMIDVNASDVRRAVEATP